MHRRGGFAFYLVGKFYQKIKILSNFGTVSEQINWVKIGDENLGEGKYGFDGYLVVGGFWKFNSGGCLLIEVF